MSNPIEDRLRQAGAADPRTLAGTERVGAERLAANRLAVDAILLAPTPSWLERALRRAGVSDGTARLVTATPALRRAWLLSVAGAVLFALSVASNSSGEGADRIVGFLTVAPLVPLLGVALAFGTGVDPTNETLRAAPIDTFRVFVIRAVTVLVTSVALLGLASLLMPAGGWHRIGWLLPSLALTGAVAVLAARFDPRHAAAWVAGGWLLAVLVATNIGDRPSAGFGPALQITCAALAVAAAVVLAVTRRRFDDAGSAA